jgi:hypothetical protein
LTIAGFFRPLEPFGHVRFEKGARGSEAHAPKLPCTIRGPLLFGCFVRAQQKYSSRYEKGQQEALLSSRSTHGRVNISLSKSMNRALQKEIGKKCTVQLKENFCQMI